MKMLARAWVGLGIVLAGCGGGSLVGGHEPGDGHDGGVLADAATSETGGDLAADTAVGASVRGLVLTPAEEPIAGVHVRAGGKEAVTDATGAFTLAGLDETANVLDVDGSTVKDEAGRSYGHARAALEPRATGERVLDAPIVLAPLNPSVDLSNQLALDATDPRAATAATDIDVAAPGAPGVSVHVPAGTKLVWPDGATRGTLSVTPLLLGKLPFAVLGGAGVALQVEPAGLQVEAAAATDGGAPALPSIVVSNDFGFADGTVLTTAALGDLGPVTPQGSATVSTVDGASVLTLTAGAPLAPRASNGTGASRDFTGCTGTCVLQCAARGYEGRVVDGAGAPIQDAEVHLGELASRALAGVVVAKARTDGRGVYRFPATNLCRWQVEVRDPVGFEGQSATQTGVVGPTGVAIQVPDLVLTRWSAPLNIEVKVVDPSGAGWPWANVYVQPVGQPENAFAAALTDYSGVARLWGVRAPLEATSRGTTAAGYEIASPESHCFIPVPIDPLPASPGVAPPPSKTDAGGRVPWNADRRVRLATNAAPLSLKSWSPGVVSADMVSNAAHPDRWVTLDATGAGISAKAKITGGGSAGFPELTCVPAGQSKVPAVRARFRPVLAKGPDATSIDVEVTNPDMTTATLALKVTTESIVLRGLSRSTFTTMQGPTLVSAEVVPPKGTNPTLVLVDDQFACIDGSPRKLVDAMKVEHIYWDYPLPNFVEATTGRFHVEHVATDCTAFLGVAASNALDYSVTNARPSIMAASPLVITATMRRLGFTFKLDGAGLTPSENVSSWWVGDRDLARPAPPGPSGGAGDGGTPSDAGADGGVVDPSPPIPPERLPTFDVDLSKNARAALAAGKLELEVPPGQLPDVLATRTSNGRRNRLGIVVATPGGGIAYTPEIKFTGDLLCADHNGGCDPVARCDDFATSVQCTCPDGYTGDGKHCADIDECQIARGGCDAFATCKNTPGSRTCTCNTGFTGNGLTCADVDECLTANGGCDVNATCSNTPGGRTCTCKPGWTGAGMLCVDPCTVNHGGCGATQTCTRTQTGATCGCLATELPDGANGCYANPCLVNNGGCGANFHCFPFPPPDPVGCECDFPNTYDPVANTCSPP
jgi:hypothetical protein